MEAFSTRVIHWQKKHGRHHLPWQGADAYCVWLSEIMLQQTQVATVLPYYLRFVATFPTVASLAAASTEDVLALWSGLGYYARGRNLHRAAQHIVAQYGGEFPRVFEQILELPGVGRSTAAAICALAYHERRAILDGNVKRVLARYCGIDGWTGEKKIEEKLWLQAENLLPLPREASKNNNTDIAIYTQALMDMGATLCTRSKPKCAYCPVQSDCSALQTNRVTELPTPRQRKAVPERHATFLLLMHDNDILLEKRAPRGIWGGLWCPPQIDGGCGITSDYMQHSGLQIKERVDLAVFTHTFTHFKLHISPVLMRVVRKPDQVRQEGERWLAVEAALQGAIPAPVRSMLLQLKRNMD